jgi:hypothetical protein
MPPQEKIPPQDNGREEKRMSQERDTCQSHPGSTQGYSKTDEDTTSRVNAMPTSLDRMPEITARNTIKQQTEVGSGEVSTWAAVKMKMARQSSLNDTGLKEMNTQTSEKLPSPIQDEKTIMDFDDMLPHIGEFGLYQKILFALLAPFAFFVAFVYFTQIFITVTPEEYWCEVPELRNLTAEQR